MNLMNFSERLKKTNEMGCLQTMKEGNEKKSSVPISMYSNSFSIVQEIEPFFISWKSFFSYCTACSYFVLKEQFYILVA